jgi:hypothetical protein
LKTENVETATKEEHRPENKLTVEPAKNKIIPITVPIPKEDVL